MDADAEFQTFLDAISDCFIARDFDAWQAHILLPFSMVTRAGPQLFDTPDALRSNFDHYLQACDAMQLDLIYRKPLALERSMDGTWVGTYETSLLSGGKRATAAYTSSALLEVVDGRFKMRSILNARGHTDWTGVAAKS
ncbi:hypothetical protein C8N43_2844 [Litoreibacter ponti]|uniref:SnoaL-like protein n=1 Tax=Litoreibacter ponti TaxID=1510457 RepID=A0A2T6BDC6_9RHOB|nr:hypothetical protein [Litoreibacter ponti]PTX54039.1 hypothetical protein C8N43_2844 [Litoreibacter ponti]